MFSLNHSIAFVFIVSTISIFSCSGDDDPVALGFGESREFPTHRALDVGWESIDGKVMSGTVYLPKETGLYAGVIWHFGSNRWTRVEYENSAIRRWLNNGIAVLTYDKRGVGSSQGECCPWSEEGYFQMLGMDVLSGIRFMGTHPDIDNSKLGAFGFSQGGWVLPVAAAQSNGDVAFTVIGSGPTVSLGEELLYSELTGENDCEPSGLSEEFINEQLEEAGSSLFDPLSYLRDMDNPGLWIFGENDLSIPVNRSSNILDGLISEFNKPFSYIVIPEANHEWIVNGSICPDEDDGPPVDMLFDIFEWIKEHI